MAIEGRYEAEYRMVVSVPPNIERNLIEGIVVSSVAWNGNMLPHCKQQTVTVFKLNPDGSRVPVLGLN